MGLKGDLTELPLPDLIEMTAMGRKTGRLVIFGPDGAVAGHLAFRDGRLAGAHCDGLSAEKAFYALLAVTTGTFEFDSAAGLDESACNLGTESLLIEGMRRLDEIQHLRRRIPAPAKVRLLGGEPGDAVETRVLGYLGPGARRVGDIVDGVLVGGHADEYETLHALDRLVERGVVRVEAPLAKSERPGKPGGPPQPELER